MTPKIPVPIVEIARGVIAPATDALLEAMVRHLTGSSNRLPSWVGKLPAELKSEIALRARQAREDLAKAGR